MLAYLIAAVLAAPDGAIAYLARRDGVQPARIHVHSLATGTARPVGPDGALERPRWSPDGQRLAYSVATPRGSAIYIADADSPDGQLIAHGADEAFGPAWSPDGGRIAYTAGQGLDAQIVVYDASTGAETVWGGGRTSLSSPVWISDRLVRSLIDPDGRGLPALPVPGLGDRNSAELIIAVGCEGRPGAMTTDLFIVSEQDVTPIAPAIMPSEGSYAEFLPAVSSDALAFESNDGGDREIFVISRRSTFDLSNHYAADWMPVWSPDGRAIAFQSFRSGRSGIYQCAPRRAGRVRVVAVHADGDCWAPAWSEDSEWLAYASDVDGGAAVFVIRPDGTDRRRISPPEVAADMPAWRPNR